MTKLYFVRHGLTENNVLHKFNGGKVDSLLIEKGINRAEKLGGYLAEKKFAKVYSSPQQRAYHTLELILSKNRYQKEIKIETNELLREIDFGTWDGTLIKEKKTHPELLHLTKQPERYNPSSFRGESYSKLLTRGVTFLNQLDYENDDSYLIVSHGVMLTTLLQVLRGKTIAQCREDGLLDNGSLNVFHSKNGVDFSNKLWNFSGY